MKKILFLGWLSLGPVLSMQDQVSFFQEHINKILDITDENKQKEEIAKGEYKKILEDILNSSTESNFQERVEKLRNFKESIKTNSDTKNRLLIENMKSDIGSTIMHIESKCEPQEEVNQSEMKTEDMPKEILQFPTIDLYIPQEKNFTQIHGGSCNLLSYLWAAFHNNEFKKLIFSKIKINEKTREVSISLHDKEYTVGYDSILKLSKNDDLDLITAAIGLVVKESIGAKVDDDYQMTIGEKDIFGNKVTLINNEEQRKNQTISLTTTGKIMRDGKPIGNGNGQIISIGITGGSISSSSNHAISVYYDPENKKWKVFDSMGTYTEEARTQEIDRIEVDSQNDVMGTKYYNNKNKTLKLKTGKAYIYLISLKE